MRIFRWFHLEKGDDKAINNSAFWWPGEERVQPQVSHNVIMAAGIILPIGKEVMGRVVTYPKKPSLTRLDIYRTLGFCKWLWPAFEPELNLFQIFKTKDKDVPLKVSTLWINGDWRCCWAVVARIYIHHLCVRGRKQGWRKMAKSHDGAWTIFPATVFSRQNSNSVPGAGCTKFCLSQKVDVLLAVLVWYIPY